MDNENEEHEVVPGSKEFSKMLFKLNESIDESNLNILNYNGNSLEEVQPDLFAMPAFVSDDFNLFFIVSPLIESDWVIAFSTATIENENEITDLSEPIPTGEGLNMLGEVSPEDANNLLKYFNKLVEANRGQWRMVEKN